MLSWKLSVAFFVFMAASAAILARGRSLTSRLTGAAVGIAVIGLLVFFVPTWQAHSEHDARLGRFVDQLCSVDVPDGVSVEECGGDIGNTGNGNSCEYRAWAIVRGGDAAEAFERPYEPAYPSSPGVEGPTFSDREGDGFKVTISQGWTSEEGDLRCN